MLVHHQDLLIYIDLGYNHMFSVYLNDLLCQLRDQYIAYHMSSHFVVQLYADDITLLDPTRNSVIALFDVCIEA